MNKKSKKLCSILLAGSMCTLIAATGISATDIDGHWAEKSMQYFIDNGWMENLAVVNYYPDTAMSRDQFVSLLNRFAKTPIESTEKDTDGIFSREDAMLIAANTLGLTASDEEITALSKFSDADEISANAKNAIAALVAGNYIHGTTAGTLEPSAQLTRAEGITILDNIYDALTFDLSEHDIVYGTATLTYADFYSGDVTTTGFYGIDGVTSATVSKTGSFNGKMYTNFTEDMTDGYNILGVNEVNIAVSADDYYDYIALNPTFKLSRTQPTQYKTVSVVDGKAVYSATKFNVAETVTDASAELQTGSTWGDYQINVTENSTAYIRNNRSDEGWLVNANIQGIILETESGLKVGMEYLQSIWVQPWEVSFNVTEESTNNSHIADWDNLPELAKLVGETVTSITYIMPDSTYVYTFDGIYIKPAYNGGSIITATFTEGVADVIVANIPEELQNVTVDIYYGSGRTKTTVASGAAVIDGKVTMTEAYNSANTYTVTVSSSNYAGIIAESPATAAERALLEVLVLQAKALIDSGVAANDSGLIEHYEEAAELLADASATSTAVVELVSELNSHLSVYNG